METLVEEYDRVPSALLLAAAGQCHGQVGYLRQNAANGRVRRELFAVEAESATLMGQLVWDASQRRDNATTLTYFDGAIAAARQVRDDFAEAHAQLRKSYVALYGLRTPKDGLSLAKAAARTAKSSSYTLAGIALMHVGEAHAMLRETRSCEKALGRPKLSSPRPGVRIRRANSSHPPTTTGWPDPATSSWANRLVPWLTSRTSPGMERNPTRSCWPTSASRTSGSASSTKPWEACTKPSTS
jgi:hypothetical protein